MKKTIDEIRTLLDHLEGETPSDDDAAFIRDFSALELPNLVNDVVDYLVPYLDPYEAAFYWYCFRHSIGENGTQYVRVSTRGLGKGIVKSASGQSNDVSQGKVKRSLANLEDVGALRKEGEANRDGTLYKVLIPEEISVCRDAIKAIKENHQTHTADENEADFYNVRENRLKIYERDDYLCKYCDKQLTRFTATLDHITPVSEGGENTKDNLVTACLSCNSRKNSRPVGDFIIEG